MLELIGFIILVILALLFIGFVAFELSPTGDKLNVIINWIFNYGIPNLEWLIELLIPISIIIGGIIHMYANERKHGLDDLGPFKYGILILSQLPFVFVIGGTGPGRETPNDLNTGLGAIITAVVAIIGIGILVLHYVRAFAHESPEDKRQRLIKEAREYRASEAARQREHDARQRARAARKANRR